MSLLQGYDNEAAPASNDWTLMYGDLMTLLLTLFVMIVSMSELKQNEKFQAVADSLAEQFGGTAGGVNSWEALGRSPGLALAHDAYQERRTKVMDGWQQYVERVSPQGMVAAAMSRGNVARNASTTIPTREAVPVAGGSVGAVAAGSRQRVLAAIQFLPESADLTDSSKQNLEEVWQKLSGRKARLEVRGLLMHSERQLGASSAKANALVLARAMAVRELLASQPGMAQVRVGLSLEELDGKSLASLDGIRVDAAVPGNVLVSLVDERMETR